MPPKGRNASAESPSDATEAKSAVVGDITVVESADKVTLPPAPSPNDGPGERTRRAKEQQEAEESLGTVRVRAIVDGFYIGRRKAGAEFRLPLRFCKVIDGQRTLPRWVELVK